MGRYYYKKMTDEEYNKKFPKVCQFNYDIKSEQELADYLAKEQCIRDPYDHVQFKVILIPNYNDKESAFIFKAHHCLADGLGLITLLMNLQDKYDKTQLPSMRKFSLLEKIYINFMTPFITLKLILKGFILDRKERNAIRSGKPLKGTKKACFSKDYSVEQIK